jgi:hypothetical protein
LPRLRRGAGGQKFIFPTPLFLFARPSDWISKFAVRIFVKKSSDFNQKVPPIFRIRILGDCCLAPPAAGLGFRHDFIRIFEAAKQFLPAQTEVRRAKLGQNEILQTNQSDNLILTA